jgi:hypothetical protein
LVGYANFTDCRVDLSHLASGNSQCGTGRVALRYPNRFQKVCASPSKSFWQISIKKQNSSSSYF